MLKNISNIGSVLNKAEQKSIIGGCPSNEFDRCDERCPEGYADSHNCFTECMDGDCLLDEYVY